MITDAEKKAMDYVDQFDPESLFEEILDDRYHQSCIRQWAIEDYVAGYEAGYKAALEKLKEQNG
jgi:hypothetical protein